MGRKYLLTTLGCKVNQYESQQIRETLESAGFHAARHGESADIAVVNTCAVTGNASRKNRQTIRRLGRQGRTPVVVVGCGASADANSLGKLNGVTAVLGHDTDVHAELRNLLRMRFGSRTTGEPWSLIRDAPIRKRAIRARSASDGPPPRSLTVASGSTADRSTGMDGQNLPVRARTQTGRMTDAQPDDPNTGQEIISHRLPIVKNDTALLGRIESFAGHQRAFLKVQDGCDACCTYCIIPRLRPQLRSKPVDLAVAEARALVHAGHQEIVVTGIFLGAYGRDTALRKRWRGSVSPLSTLVDALAGVDGLQRLRLSSLEPGDVDDALLETIASHENCVPHLHLPLQSGSDSILRRMNRQYNRDAFVKMIDRVRTVLDRPAITTDLIVGFPGETEEDFQASIRIARYAQFCKIHAFPFSPRQHTAAARWRSAFVKAAIVRQRMQRLSRIEQESSLSFRSRFVGCTERVIVEDSTAPPDFDVSSHSLHRGRADRYFMVNFEHPEARPGDLVMVRMDRVTPGRTQGTAIAVLHNPG